MSPADETMAAETTPCFHISASNERPDNGRLHEAGGLEEGSLANAGHLPRDVALAEA